MDKKTALKIARNYVRFLISHRHYKIKKAFLFGSCVRNKSTVNSDIDIALILKDYKDTVKELTNLMRFRRNFDLRIEPHPINEKDFQKSNPFASEIKKGLKIF